ncbi:MAG TPA: alginate lyase family protein [Phycisphaerae bacterium]|nr:alginate lyase family protein [Phycisphaerae bacterium]
MNDSANASEPSPFFLTDASAWRQCLAAMAGSADAQDQLARESDAWLEAAPPNIVRNKRHVAPSGDPHDYISIGPYWWPDETKPDGLPWIRRDGQINPQFYEYDSLALETFCQSVSRLVLRAAAGCDAHARRAGDFLRAWFLDAETRMNPHLRYAQFIPGVCDGRGIGIIDTSSLVFLLDAVTHLPPSAAWTAAEMAGLREWVSCYLDWLLDSEPGRQEQAEPNNHGTRYDAQLCALACFCGRRDVARRQIETRTLGRIASQIEPDGGQPRELARTLSLTYCTYNLLALACLAQLGKGLGIDLWRHETPDGRSILRALRWMLPYYAGTAPWTGKQLRPFDFAASALLLQLAWQGTGEAALDALAAKNARFPWRRLTFSKAALAARTQPAGGTGNG